PTCTAMPSDLLTLPPRATLCPYTPLFRSRVLDRRVGAVLDRVVVPGQLVPGQGEHLAHTGLQVVVDRLDQRAVEQEQRQAPGQPDRKSTRLNSSHVSISYAVVCVLKKEVI